MSNTQLNTVGKATQAGPRKATRPRPGKAALPPAGETILTQGISVPYDNVCGGRNDNVLVVGGTGTGKTRSVVRPNLLQATGSYIVSDPKGNLYDLYAPYLRAKGYRVERLDFVQPSRSTVYYNLFQYLEDETDVLRVAHLLTTSRPCDHHADPFWEYSSELLLEACIAYLMETEDDEQCNLAHVLQLIRKGHRVEYSNNDQDSSLDELMRRHKENHEDGLAIRAFESISLSPTRTWDSICVSATAKYGAYDTAELSMLMRKDTVRLGEIGQRPTAIFVVVSDTDRTMDPLANLFFSQAMQILCRTADARPDSRLPVPVRFILDDFATNVRIEEFPRMISSIRSRGISAMLMIQAEAQLHSGYGDDAETIISNCDTYLYLGGNDIQTARRIADRCGLEMREILYMPLGTCWLFRRGEQPRQTTIFDLASFETARMAEVTPVTARLLGMPIKERDRWEADIIDRKLRNSSRWWAEHFDEIGIDEISWIDEDDPDDGESLAIPDDDIA